MIERAIRDGGWVLAVGGAKHSKPITLKVLSAIGAAEDWELSARGSVLQINDTHRVETIYRNLDLDGNGVIDQNEFATHLKASDGTITDAETGLIFAQADANSDGYLDYEELLRWMCGSAKGYSAYDHACKTLAGTSGRDRTEATAGAAAEAEPPCSVGIVSGGESEQEEGEDGEDEDEAGIADITVEWVDPSGKTQSVTFPNVLLDITLASFKKHCAKELGVDFVRPHDYNEDMDPSFLSQLGIGTSDLPFLVELGPPRTSVAPTSGAHREHDVGPDHSEGKAPNAGARGFGEGSRSGCGGMPALDAVSPAVLGDSRHESSGRSCKAAGQPFAVWQALKDASNVKDGWLFLGGQMAAGNLTALQQLGVTHVLNCCDRIPCKFKASITYKVLPINDTRTSDVQVFFPEALDFIDKARASDGGILVHCMVGASRSTSLVLAWFVSRCRMPLSEAFKHVRTQRHVARPNRGFCQQLMDYEKDTLGSCSATLAEFFHT